jgi:16S rRNA processing protein RimM
LPTERGGNPAGSGGGPAGGDARPAGAGDELILVGFVARAHGLRGEVVVDVYSDAPDRFAAGSALVARAPDGGTRGTRIAESRPFAGRLLVRFEGVADRDAAEALRDTELLVPRSEVAPLPPGRHYRFELLGLRVRTRAGEELGVVAEVFATGSNDVLVVRGERGEMLLPVLDTVVLEVSEERGEMTVEVPPGLPGPA